MANETLSDHELEEALSDMDLFAAQDAMPWARRGSGDWTVWSCTSQFAGRLATTIRNLQMEVRSLRSALDDIYL
jgi:hypothetical protein